MFGLENAKDSKIPMSTTCKLEKDVDGILVDQRLYRSMIGSLLYLTSSRPDIILSVCLCARFQPNPMESHLKVVKKIIKCAKQTTNFSFYYPIQSHLDLSVYTNSYFYGSKCDMKSTSGACFFLESCLVSSMCKKQSSIAFSTAET